MSKLVHNFHFQILPVFFDGRVQHTVQRISFNSTYLVETMNISGRWRDGQHEKRISLQTQFGVCACVCVGGGGGFHIYPSEL